MPEPCPSLDDLSAWLDGEAGHAQAAVLERHAAGCPACAAALADLRQLRDGFARLPEPVLGFDLGSVIEGRLAAAPATRRRAAPARRWWRLAPAWVGAAGALSLGLVLGSALVGTGAGVARAPIMAVFDPIPPGGLCIGMETCYAKDLVK